MEVTTIGGDPALRHGAFVIATWSLSNKHRLVDYEVLFSWTKKDAHLSEKSTLAGIQRACKAIVTPARELANEHAPCPVAIDWTSSTGFMGRRITASVLSFFIGYLSKEFEMYGFPVIIISPAEVREQLGLGYRVPKEDVWHVLRRMLDNSQARMPKDIASDLRDALILSYLAAVGRIRNEAGQGIKARLSVS